MPTRPPGTPDVDLTFDGANGTINGAVFMTGLLPVRSRSILLLSRNQT